MDIDAFAEVLEEMVARVPPELLQGLAGGVNLAEEARRDPGDPPNAFILGEYFADSCLGNRIVFYHGSFTRLFAGQPRAVWEQEIWNTLRHEIRHHVEGMAGIEDLDVEDRRQLARLREQVGPV